MIRVYCYKTSAAAELAEKLKELGVKFENISLNELLIDDEDYEKYRDVIDEYATDVRPYVPFLVF